MKKKSKRVGLSFGGLSPFLDQTTRPRLSRGTERILSSLSSRYFPSSNILMLRFVIFLCPRACLRIWSRQTGLAVPSRVSLLISILRLASVWINRVRLPILHVVSSTGKMNCSLSAFAPENLVSRDGFGSSPVPRQPAHLHTLAESGARSPNSRLNVVLTYGIPPHTVLLVRRANCPCCSTRATGDLCNSFL